MKNTQDVINKTYEASGADNWQPAKTSSDCLIHQNIAAAINTLPDEPGVYMYYQNEKLLYVGKAKSLKNRVRSYFSFSPKLAANPRLSDRIKLMLKAATNLIYHITPSELDALVLENSLIKQLHPKFNILLRDDKTYPYIVLDTSAKFPRFEITRTIKKGQQFKYFGPYTNGAKALLQAIYESYKLRQKRSCKHICLFAQIKRCLAPCEFDKSVEKDYEIELQQAINAIKNPKKLKPLIEAKMLAASEEERFEEAIRLRDILFAIDKITNTKSELDLAHDISFDVIAAAQNNDEICAVRMIIEHGKVISVIEQKGFAYEPDEFIKAFIQAQYKQLIPKLIYVHKEFSDQQLLSEFLSFKAQYAVKIKLAKNPKIQKLAQSALNNAALVLKTAPAKDPLKLLQTRLNLTHLPTRIEVFDNSMLQASAVVGAMVSYENGWLKSNYRKYLLDANNDYEQMRQMLSRRIVKFGELAAPDLWVIDGGKALLDLAQNLLQQAGANIDVIAISKQKRNHLAYRAKGAACDLIYFQDQVLKLSTNDPLLLFVQMLRDEAHRFAISTFRALKRKQDMQLSNLAKAGISAASISKLIKYFGSFEAIMQADYEQIRTASNKTVADKLSNFKSQQKI